MFPSKVFGRIEETETKEVGSLAIMTREEGLRLTNELSRLTLPKDRQINYSEIATTLTNVQAKQEIVQNDEAFVAVQQDFSLDLIDHIECSGEQRNALRKFFIHPGVFDGFVGVMVQELRKKPMRPHLCDQKARRALIS